MNRVTLSPLGFKAARVSQHQRTPGKRSTIASWSVGAARRNESFLKSINPDRLTGDGYAVTLTLRDCPASHTDWQILLKRFMDRVHKLPVLRLHWVVEWQLRSRFGTGPVPHLHMMIFMGSEAAKDQQRPFGRFTCAEEALLFNWLTLAMNYGVSIRSQHVKRVRDTGAGWLQYMGKHGSRGVAHYQRSEDLPQGWQQTGRMWGHRGQWPTEEERFEISNQLFFKLRRFHRRYQLAAIDREAVKARRWLAGDALAERLRSLRRRKEYIRRRLQRPAKVSPYVGLSEWMPEHVIRRWLFSVAVPVDHITDDGEILPGMAEPENAQAGRSGPHAAGKDSLCSFRPTLTDDGSRIAFVLQE